MGITIGPKDVNIMNVCFSFNEWFVVGTIIAYLVVFGLYKMWTERGGVEW